MLRPAVYASCLFCFGVCFMLQAWDALSKYLEGAVTISVRRRQDPNLLFPSLAFCPSHGYNRSAMSEMGLHEEQWRVGGKYHPFHPPANRQEADEWFESSTYSAESLITSAYFFNGTSEKIKWLFRKGQWGNESFLAAQGVGSFDFGRCYVMSCLLPIQSFADFMRIRLNFPEGVDEIRMESFGRGMELFGIATNYWQGPVQQLVVRPGLNHFIEVKKSSLALLSQSGERCQKSCSLRNEMSCFYHASLRFMDRPICYWPILAPWSYDNATVCGSYDALYEANSIISKSKYRVNARSVCPPCCNSFDFTYSVRTAPSRIKNSALIIFYFQDLRTEFGEEKLLYDFNNIVAAVGGSIGLFLGFSFLEFSLKVFDCVRRKNRIIQVPI